MAARRARETTSTWHRRSTSSRCCGRGRTCSLWRPRMEATAPNPAGLIGTLVIKFRDGHTLTVPTDKNLAGEPNRPGQMDEGRDGRGGLERGDGTGRRWASGRGGPSSRQRAETAGVLRFWRRIELCWASWASRRTSSRTARCATRTGATGEADIYFVANREDRPVEATCTFRVSGKAPELWDPLTGQMRALPEFACARRAHDCAPAL